MGEEEKCIQDFDKKARRKETTRRRWEGNIKMDIREAEWVLWTGLIWLRVRISGVLL
jgi:hypothetical protein